MMVFFRQQFVSWAPILTFVIGGPVLACGFRSSLSSSSSFSIPCHRIHPLRHHHHRHNQNETESSSSSSTLTGDDDDEKEASLFSRLTKEFGTPDKTSSFKPNGFLSSTTRRRIFSSTLWSGLMIGSSGVLPPSSTTMTRFASTAMAATTTIGAVGDSDNYNVQVTKNPRGAAVISIRIESSSDPLGIEVSDSTLRGRPVVVVTKRVMNGNSLQKKKMTTATSTTAMANTRIDIQPGMIVEGYTSSKQLSDKLKTGPFPIDLKFRNLAAGGDAFDDFGSTIVSPQDAFEIVKKTDDDQTTRAMTAASSSSSQSSSRQGLVVRTIQRPDGSPSHPCAMSSRRGDLLEITYEASYVKPAGNKNGNGKSETVVMYDASAFRGTGRPYQVVLGTGDLIPGVDQGLYDMCPGEVRTLSIPPVLGYSSAGTQLFKIPPDYIGLEWTVELVSIEGIVREDNNNLSRQERDGRS